MESGTAKRKNIIEYFFAAEKKVEGVYDVVVYYENFNNSVSTPV